MPSDWVTPKEFLRENPKVVSRTTLYDWIRQKQIDHLRIGSKILIRRDAFDRLHSRQSNGS